MHAKVLNHVINALRGTHKSVIQVCNELEIPFDLSIQNKQHIDLVIFECAKCGIWLDRNKMYRSRNMGGAICENCNRE